MGTLALKILLPQVMQKSCFPFDLKQDAIIYNCLVVKLNKPESNEVKILTEQSLTFDCHLNLVEAD